VILDYGQPRAVLSPADQAAYDALAARVQVSGEPFQLFFTVAEMAAELGAFTRIEDMGIGEVNARYFAGRTDGLGMRGAGGRMVSAWK
jgi:hypothetical protein